MPKPAADPCSCDHGCTTAAVASGRPTCLGKGEEAAKAGQPVRARAHFLEVSPGNSFRESPAAAGSAAITRQAQELSRFAVVTVIQFEHGGNTKTLPGCEEAVDDESSLWMNEEN